MDPTNPIRLVHNDDTRTVHNFIKDTESELLLLNLYSTRGIGKTTFLKRVRDEFQRQQPTAFVRVQEFIGTREEGGYRLDQFLRTILNQLQAWVSTDALAPSKRNNATAKDVLTLAQTIIEFVQDFAAQKLLPLLLIDDYDRLPAGPRTVFESAVLSRIIAPPSQAKVLLSSEQELQFTERFDLRIRLKPHKLAYLTEEDIQHSAPQYAELASEIREWTGGMPDLVDFFVAEANRRQIDNAEEYRSRRQELLGPQYRKQIQNVVFSDVRIVSEDALDVLAILRRFDVATLSAILPQIYPDNFVSFKQKHYLDLIRQLGSRVSWRPQGGYALDDMLRTMLSSYAKTFEPGLYAQVHQIAAATYETWLQEDYRLHYLTEMLYHKMELDRLRGVEDKTVAANLNHTLQRFVENWQKDHPQRINNLASFKDVFEADEDLKPFFTSETFSTINYVLKEQFNV